MFKNLLKKLLVYGLVFCVMFVLCFGYYIHPTRAQEDRLELIIPASPELGGKMTVAVQTSVFEQSSSQNQQYVWSLNRRTLAPLQAGSKDKFINNKGDLANQYGELKNTGSGYLAEADLKGGVRTCFSGERVKDVSISLHRTAKVDADGDGMDDNWEKRYFSDLSHDGTKDSDRDGWDWNTTFPEKDRETGNGGGDIGIAQEGDYCNKGCKDQHCACRTGVPCVTNPKTGKRYVTGDGYFTDYEEYVFGTNPINSDADGDGVLDEADVSGIGGQSFTFKLNRNAFKIGDRVAISAFVYGKVRPKFDWESLGSIATGAAIGALYGGLPGAIIGGILGSIFKCDRNYLSLIAAEYIVVSPGPPLNVILQADPEVPTLENTGEEGAYPPVKVAAQVVGEKDTSRLYYKWYIGTTFMEDNSGYGRNELEFPVLIGPCGKIPITCDVSEEETGKIGSAELRLDVGENINDEKLDAYLVGNAMAGETVDPCALKDPAGDYTAENVKINDAIDGSGFVRQNDIIEIFANDNLDLCGKPKSDYIFQWFLNGKEQTDQSGKAKDKFRFTVTKPPGDTHLVKLKLIRISDGFKYGQLGEKVFTVVGPEISSPEGEDWIKFDGTGDVYTEATQSDGTTVHTITLKSGQTENVTLDSVLKNFRPTHSGVESFHYYWTINGDSSIEEIPLLDYTNCTAEEKKGTYCETLEAEKSITVPFNYVEGGEETTYNIALKVDNLIDEDTSADETATRSAIVKIKYETGARTRGPVTRLFAQAGGAISNYFKNIFNIVLSLGIIGFIVFVVMAAGQFRKRE